MFQINIFVTFQSLYFAWGQAFAGILLASSDLLGGPSRSCDRLDDDHMTAVVHSRREELVPLVAAHGRLFYFNFDGHELRPGLRLPPPIYDELLQSCDRRQGGHMSCLSTIHR